MTPGGLSYVTRSQPPEEEQLAVSRHCVARGHDQ